jgi:hypothetical protein
MAAPGVRSEIVYTCHVTSLLKAVKKNVRIPVRFSFDRRGFESG